MYSIPNPRTIYTTIADREQVCCSAYGFCGTTSDFCSVTDDDDSSCQSNCDSPTEPSCSSNDVLKKVIGYYESWSTSRTCDSWTPSNIAASSLTHINYAFALFQEQDTDDWAISWDQTDENDLTDLISEFIGLKTNNPGLSCFLSIGGW
jgi:chitinase